LFSVGIPVSWSLLKAKELFSGALRVCSRYGVHVVGGDTTRAERLFFSVTLVGEPTGFITPTRSGARLRDVVFVTGVLGGAVKSGKHLKFVPRFKESHFLVRHYRVRAMMDLSDGLAKDLRTLMSESRMGVRIFDDAIPLAHGASVSDAFQQGEDFELLFTLPVRAASRLLRDPRLRRRGYRFYPIGRVSDRREGLRRIDRFGMKRRLPQAHDHHFSHGNKS